MKLHFEMHLSSWMNCDIYGLFTFHSVSLLQHCNHQQHCMCRQVSSTWKPKSRWKISWEEELEKLLSKHDCLTTTKMDYKKFTFLLFFVFQPHWILGGDVICSLEDYVLTGIEFGDCQSEAMKSYGSDDDKARNPCSELKNVVDNCARLVSVSSWILFDT